MKRLSLQVLVLSLALLVPVVVAQALPVWLNPADVVGSAGPQSSPMMITAGMLEMNSTSTTVSPDGETVTFGMGSLSMAGMWDLNWTSITLDRDPNVSLVGGFTNTSMMATDFVFAISTPISPTLTSTLYGGSTTVTYGDGNNDGLGGLLNDSSSNPAYTGTIDGTGTLNMLASLSLTPDFPGQTKATGETQGLPGPTIPGGAANSNIGILHRFNLSPSDNATFNSTFVVVIPEPGTIALFATGLGGLALLGRRRMA